MAVALTVGTLGGIWLDRTLETTPYLMWFGVMVGVGAGTKTIMRVIKSTDMNRL